MQLKADTTIDVVVPARNVAFAIEEVARSLSALRDSGAIDRVLVIDGDSSDDTARNAARGGAEVVAQAAVLPRIGHARGKGDALWRALSLSDADIVCFVDGDSVPFDPGYVLGLIGPMLEDPALRFVRGFFDRPFKAGDTVHPEGGGRVTELMAKPLLRQFFPALAAFEQPLAGEFALTRELAWSLPFPVGYGVEIATLIDVWRAVGLDAMGQSDLGSRQNHHKRLRDLSPMASEVLATVLSRLGDGDEVAERPPLIDLLARAA